MGRSVDGRKSTESSFTYYRGSACFLLYSTNIFINLNLICLSAEVQIDESVVMQLVSMGFDKEGCRKAVYHTNNQGMIIFILLLEKLLQFDWLRAVVFQLNLKYLHVKITKPLRVVV